MSNSERYTFQERDEFNREHIADKIIKLLNSTINVSPMIIDGSWGVGKTEFCQKLITKMNENDKNHLIYIDAFKADHANEPLLTVLAAVLDILPNNETKETLRKKVLPVLRYGLKVGGKALFSHIFKQDSEAVAEGLESEINKAAEQAIDASVDSLLQDHIDSEKNLIALQHTLKQVAEEKPIILFIDELDRCRPDFAVLMLETIKHVFDINNVKFVLITNTRQLKASINHCYGLSIDAERYLDKFIKFRFLLPNITNGVYSSVNLASVRHYENLIRKSPYLNNLEIERDSCLHLLEKIFEQNNTSLREVETFVRNLEVYQVVNSQDGINSRDSYIYKIIKILSIALATYKPQIAQDLLENRLNAEDFVDFTGINKLWSLENGRIFPLDAISYLYVSNSFINSELYNLEDTQKQYLEDFISKATQDIFYFGGDDILRKLQNPIRKLWFSN
ncbi:KAP family P-loop NTPase fold protein [Photobacterium leiognathi]|uniref:KAP family P-loop NTPase fold protein n=1 Tax=Photobacterium leiognathi TaxID=553611 RepID=UPI0029819AB6|nr:KAP family NTPase [Photobacterium leiognathi]